MTLKEAVGKVFNVSFCLVEGDDASVRLQVQGESLVCGFVVLKKWSPSLTFVSIICGLLLICYTH